MTSGSTQALRTKAWVRRLHDEYDHICFTYRLDLKRPVIRVDDFGARYGLWDSELREISIATGLIENYPWICTIEILKHEMAHQIVTEEWGSDEMHGPLFRRACARLGMQGWAMRAEGEIEVPAAGATSSPLKPDELRLVERAEKLLRLANSQNENEASAAMRKVRELYARFEIARLEGQQRSDYGSLILYTGKKRIERYQSAIAGLLNDHFLVDVIHISVYDPNEDEVHKALELLGTAPNTKMAEYVYHFLCQSVESLWKTSRKAKKRTLSQRNSFYLGVLAGFRERIETQTESKESTGQALVVPRDPGLDAYVQFKHPRLIKIGGGRRRFDPALFDFGKAKGRDLVLRRALDNDDGSGKSFLKRFLPGSR